MLVRKFEAENMAAALRQVKETLGSEALILSTRTLGKKGLGVLGRQTIEVTAAIESPAMKGSPRHTLPGRGEAQPAGFGKIPAAYSQRVETLEDETVSLSRPIRSQKVDVAGHPLEEEVQRLRVQLESQNVNRLQDEVNQLKTLMQQLTRQQAQQVVDLATGPESESLPLRQAVPGKKPQAAVTQLKTESEKTLQELLEILVERGIEREAAATIARFAAPQMNDRQRLDPEQQLDFLTSTVAGPAKGIVKGVCQPPRAYVFVPKQDLSDKGCSAHTHSANSGR